ncbi:heterokaryon incompatibility protein-domain-containing protein [Cladorrhinum sp. PSN332]|nr:heterokaryon incompatibility protein-domain-containing protein [Cladorrhinum sp. PSN332]
MTTLPVNSGHRTCFELCLPLQLYDGEFGGQGVTTSDGRRFVRFDPDKFDEVDGRYKSLNDSFPNLVNLSTSADNGCLYCAFLLAILRSVDVTALLGDISDDFKNGKVLPFSLRAAYGCTYPESGSNMVNWMGFEVAFDDSTFDIICTLTRSPENGNHVSTWLGLESNDYSYLQAPNSYVEMALDWAKTELANCDNHVGAHNCAGMAEPSFVPTRLVKIKPEDSDDILQLVSGPALRTELGQDTGHQTMLRYTTLSYCWGTTDLPQPSFMTTSKNEHERTVNGFRVSELPVVLQDAIRVSRQLSISYIWIDALCILQDTGSDWLKESALLIDIYRSSYITICSLTPSSHNSFLSPPPRPKIQVDFQSSIDREVTGTNTLSYKCLEVLGVGWNTYTGDFEDDESGRIEPNNRWQSRGWTFLERYSSRRMVLISMPFCGVICPNYQKSFGSRFDTRDEPCFENLHGDFSTDSEPYPPGNYYSCWNVLVTAYSRRILTYVQDILPALAGIARWYATKLSDKYVAGLWESKLVETLGWRCVDSEHVNGGRMPRTLEKLLSRLNSAEGYIAPSWSWAGRRVEIDAFLEPRSLCQLMASTVPIGSDIFGRIKDGQLIIVGKVLNYGPVINMSFHQNSSARRAQFKMALSDETDAICRLDWRPSGQVIDSTSHWNMSLKLILIGLFKGEHYFGDGEEHAYGLLLHKAQRKGCYVRVGTFTIKSDGDGTVPEPFGSAATEKVTVI